MTELAELTTAIERGDRATAVRLTREAIDAGSVAGTILDAMILGMQNVGAQFQRNEVFVPEMLIAARAMQESTAVLEPLLVASGIRPEHTAIIGTVKGDLHDIGKNLVGMMWKGAKFQVIDLGTDVPAERFVEAARQHQAEIVGISALLTTTMVGMRDVITAIRSAGLGNVKVVIGGAPTTQAFADEIGADGFAPDAAEAVLVARRVLGHA
jgi:5-methyltetrahydrofolate--homocysteine methyltransferase